MRELVFDFPAPRDRLPPCKSVRSTLLGSSVLALRDRGHFDRWHRLVDTSARETILFTPAGVWLPLPIAEAHYDACERLGLPQDEILGMGNAVARLTQQTVLAFALRLASESGTTPMMALGYTQRLWARLYEGSGVSLWKAGPKDAEILIAGNPLSRFAYWRTGLRGILRSLVSPFASNIYVREMRLPSEKDHPVSYRIAWV